MECKRRSLWRLIGVEEENSDQREAESKLSEEREVNLFFPVLPGGMND